MVWILPTKQTTPIYYKKMARDRVMVEINLSSNEGILNIAPKDHPLPFTLQYGVPLRYLRMMKA